MENDLDMKHLRQRYVTDPETGLVYAIPMGGAGSSKGKGADDQQQDDEDEEEEDDDDEDESGRSKGKGKADDDDEDEDEDEEEDEDDDDTPLSKAEARKIRKALRKANAEAKRYRLEAKDLKRKNESETERQLREAREEGESAGVDKMKKALIRSAATVALTDEGLTSKPGRFINMIDHEEIEVDDEGNLSGLDDQVAKIKEDFPELFDDEDDDARPRRRRQVHDIDKGDKTPSRKRKSSAERLAAQAGG